MEEIAEVVELRDNKAVVRLERHSACRECNRRCGLAGFNSAAEEILVEVDNTAGARVGDKVRLNLEGKRGLQAALIIFLLPLLSMLLGYFAAVRFLSHPDPRVQEGLGFGVAVAFLVLAFLGIRYLDRRGAFARRFNPRMVAVFDYSGGE